MMIGASFNITWTPASPAQYIYLSTDNGINWSVIVNNNLAGVASPYSWTVPNSIATQCLVKVLLLDGRIDQSDSVFSISRPITLLSPVGGEDWQIGSTHSISWNALHDPVTYIYYSTNNGVGWVSLIHTAAGITSPYNWTIPNTPSTQCRVRVNNETNTERDTSFALFTISTPPVVLTEPNGGGVYYIGASRTISWTPTDNARYLHYTTNNGTAWTEIIGSASPGISTPYTWTLPNVNSTQCRVKVTMLDGRVDSSDNVFTITNPITLTAPVGGETLMVGSVSPIAWTALHDPVNYIYYTTNNGTSWISIGYNAAGYTSPYNWTIPNTASTQCRVKVYNTANTEKDSSHAYFTIAVPPVTLTSPNGGESWYVGSVQSITWTPSTSNARYVHYTTNNGTSWVEIAGSVSPGIATPYSWTVPNLNTTTCKVRVLMADGRRDSSNAPFTIGPPMTLNSPNGGETWSAGTSYNITWTALHDPVAYIYYTTNSGTSWINIAQNPTGFTSPYAWTVPNTASTTCRVKVYNFTNTERDSSNASFTIVIPPLALTAPNGGESWNVGTSHNITWNTSTNAQTLAYTTNNGTAWITIASSTSPGIPTPYAWTIPSTPSTQCRVRVILLDARRDSSDNVFTIPPPIVLTSPNGGESLSAGSTTPIAWTAAHDPRRLHLLYDEQRYQLGEHRSESYRYHVTLYLDDTEYTSDTMSSESI